MTKEELLARLQSIEWSELEFKDAAWAVPKDALTTVSAFANTIGGHLVFGVTQGKGIFTVTGVVDADKVQNDFLGQVRDTHKISVFLPIDGKVHALAEGVVLAFYIPEANVFAWLTRKGQIDLTDVKALTGLSGAEARQLVQRLTVQAVLVAAVETDDAYCLADHLHSHFPSALPENNIENQMVGNGKSGIGSTAQATEQVVPGQTQLVQSLAQLSAIQRQIVAFSNVPRSIAELTHHTGHKQRAFFKRTHLEPLLAGGILQMTVPDKPTSPAQRYVLTATGLKLRQLHMQPQTIDPTDESHGH